MSDRLAEAYFHWLVEQVREHDGHQRKTYWDLLRVLNETEFIWLVPNDDNRIVDGMDLRTEFLRESGHRRVNIKQFGSCSVLEVLVGLSRRLAFIAGGEPEGWAWQLLCNLELHKYKDPVSERRARSVREILHMLVWRTYSPDGIGGFFPLAWPEKDQRKVELWYQMNSYAKEIHPEYGKEA